MNDLLFSRFLQLRDLLVKAVRRENDDKLILCAFVGWQMGAGAGKKFSEYLAELGLAEKRLTEAIPEDRELTAKEAVAKAEEILALARKKDKA